MLLQFRREDILYKACIWDFRLHVCLIIFIHTPEYSTWKELHYVVISDPPYRKLVLHKMCNCEIGPAPTQQIEKLHLPELLPTVVTNTLLCSFKQLLNISL